MKRLNLTPGEYARLRRVAPVTGPIVEGHLLPVIAIMPTARALGLDARDLTHDSPLVVTVRRDVLGIPRELRITEAA